LKSSIEICQEQIEDSKCVLEGQIIQWPKEKKMANNDLQHTTHKTKY